MSEHLSLFKGLTSYLMQSGSHCRVGYVIDKTKLRCTMMLILILYCDSAVVETEVYY